MFTAVTSMAVGVHHGQSHNWRLDDLDDILHRSSIDVFKSSFNFETYTKTLHKFLTVVETNGKERLKVVRDPSVLKTLKLALTPNLKRVARFVQRRIDHARETGEGSEWLDQTDDKLKLQYAWLDRKCKSFENPLKDKLTVRVRIPQVSKDGAQTEDIRFSIDYDRLDTVEKVHKKVMDYLAGIPVQSEDHENVLPLKCFLIRYNLRDRYNFGKLLQADPNDRAHEMVSSLKRPKLHMELVFDEAKLGQSLYDEGYASGLAQAKILGRRSSDYQATDFVDKDKAYATHCHSDSYYNGFLAGFKSRAKQ